MEKLIVSQGQPAYADLMLLHYAAIEPGDHSTLRLHDYPTHGLVAWKKQKKRV
jgi:hypothetical protein